MKQLFKITGETREMLQPVLAIQLGEKHCAFGISDHASGNLQQLAYYAAEEINPGCIDVLFQLHPELLDRYYQVMVEYDFPQSCIVPAQFFNKGDGNILLSVVTGLPPGASVISEAIPEWQIHTVYGVPRHLHDKICQTFTSGKYWHHYTVDIKKGIEPLATGKLLINFRKDDFTCLLAGEGKLLLAQTFSYSTPDDVIYYLLRICRQFGFTQQEILVELTGLIDKRSALYREIHLYFIQVSFRDADWKMPEPDEIPGHFFTSLNDLARCAS